MAGSRAASLGGGRPNRRVALHKLSWSRGHRGVVSVSGKMHLPIFRPGLDRVLFWASFPMLSSCKKRQKESKSTEPRSLSRSGAAADGRLGLLPLRRGAAEALRRRVRRHLHPSEALVSHPRRPFPYSAPPFPSFLPLTPNVLVYPKPHTGPFCAPTLSFSPSLPLFALPRRALASRCGGARRPSSSFCYRSGQPWGFRRSRAGASPGAPSRSAGTNRCGR